MVIDPAFDRAFYKLAGFRSLGRRAVRVDILERLADLIRPALSWKTGLGTRPDGAYDGSAFMVTPPMMSILGANADDIEEILKGLGYRAEPKPAAEVKARLEAIDQAAREAAAAAAAKAEAEKAATGRLLRRRKPSRLREATAPRLCEPRCGRGLPRCAGGDVAQKARTEIAQQWRNERWRLHPLPEASDHAVPARGKKRSPTSSRARRRRPHRSTRLCGRRLSRMRRWK